MISETDAGVLYGMAWALAEDDWPLIEENYLRALGRAAELVGDEGFSSDWMARALEIRELSTAEYESASPRLRMLLDAYAAGMNQWLTAHPSAARILQRIEPWYPLALVRYKYYQNEFLGYAGLQSEWIGPIIARSVAGAQGPATERKDSTRSGSGELELLPPPTGGLHAFSLESQFDAWGRRPQGSNQWALAPARTANGAAMLLINPHQSFVGVQRYAEIHLDSDEGLRFSGLTVFGFLLPYMGHNDRLGWAYTDNYADHSDLYALTFDDGAEPLKYRYNGGHRTAGARTDSIRVRTAEGLRTIAVRLWTTHHGPVVGVADDGRPLAVRLARMRQGGWFKQWDEMIRARTLAEWQTAVGQLRVAYMNTMYADADGNIGYIYNSAVPRRLAGVDPSGILDGSDPRNEWQGFHSLGELPQVWNPRSGWLANTNSTPFTVTDDLPYDQDDFPSYMVGPESNNARALSSQRILRSLRQVTFDSVSELVWDSRLSAADILIPELAVEWQRLSSLPRRHRLAVPVGRLLEWDRVADTASVEATWFILANERRILSARAGEVNAFAHLRGLEDALDLLLEEWGTIEVPWGSISRHQRPLPERDVRLDPTRRSLAVGGAPGALGSVFSFETSPFGVAAPRIGRGGNSFVKLISFGPAVRALSVLNYGQSGDPGSAHFFDQAELYSRREFKPAWFTREDVEANAVRTYTVPRNR